MLRRSVRGVLRRLRERFPDRALVLAGRDDFQFPPEHQAILADRLPNAELTLIERAEETLDQEQAVETATKMLEGSFNLEDFLKQLQQIKRLGPLGQLLDMIPGMAQYKDQVSPDVTDGQVMLLPTDTTVFAVTPPAAVIMSRALRRPAPMF